MILFVLTMVFSVFSYDYTFSFTDKFITDFVNNYKDALKESGIKNFKMDFKGGNKGEITMTYKSIIPLEVKFNINAVSKNRIKFYITKFKALGFLPISKKMLVEKVTKAIEELPEVNQYLKIEVAARGDDDEYSLDMRITKNPIPAVPELSIEDAAINGSSFSLFGMIGRGEEEK